MAQVAARTSGRPTLSLSLQFAPEARGHRAALPRHRVARWIRAALDQPGEITVRIVGSDEARTLNRDYRQKDYATNVLTFDYSHAPLVHADLVLCAEVVETEACEQGLALEAHYAHLLVHGTLHAQGHDHEHDDEAEAMETRESELLLALGFADPLPPPAVTVAVAVTDAGSLPLVDAALRGALVATLTLVGWALWKERSPHPVARVGMALMAGLVVQTFAATPVVEQGWPAAWQAPLVGVSVGNAALFWLFARAMFDDDFALGARHVGLWAAVVAVGVAFCLSIAVFGPHSVPTRVLAPALRWMPALFAALVIVAAASEWRADLVERRRMLRRFIVVAGTVYTATMVALRLAAPHGVLSASAAGVDTGALLLIALVTALTLLRLRSDELLPRGPGGGPHPPPPGEGHAASVTAIRAPAAGLVAAAALPVAASTGETVPNAAEQRLAESLQRLMTHGRVYRIDDLTLGVLALKLGVPEYRLRRHINQRLGQRNFNTYVNGWRLAQARAALADPAQRESAVLAIAMDAGFASIGPFNRAFKAAFGCTPSEFRRRALADS